MVSKGFMKPEDICKVDYEGKQLAGTRKRSSEILLHLAVYKNRPDVKAVVHCHPPHATAFAVAGEPIPKCVLPEVEVFLGEVPTAKYETPGTQKFADTIVPHPEVGNTIILANHGTVTFGPDLEKAYWNSEIIDAYCKILILAKQLGSVNYFTQQADRRTARPEEEARLRRHPLPSRRQLRPVRQRRLRAGFQSAEPVRHARRRRRRPARMATQRVAPDMDKLVKLVTDQVMAALAAIVGHADCVAQASSLCEANLFPA